MTIHRDIAVIGAGPSGLSAARTLVGSGREVIVIDQGRGPGGRLSTRRGPDGVRLDHGCQFVTVEQNALGLLFDDMTQSDVVSSWKASTGNRTVDKPFAEPDWPVGVPTMSSVPKWL